MIAYLLWIAAALVVAYIVYDALRSRLKKNIRTELKELVLFLVGAAAIVALILAFSRSGSVGQILAAATVFVLGTMRYLGIMVRLRAWAAGLYREFTGSRPRAARSSMSVSEAAAILDVDENCDKAAIVAAHRLKMRESHPDRGGSTKRAQLLNEAREVLLENLRNRPRS